MRTLAVALFMTLLTLALMGCKDSGPPCADGPALKAIGLPVTFHVHKSDSYLGAVTLSETGEPSFEAAGGAPADALKDFREDFERAASGDSVSFRFETMRGDTRHMCGTSVKRGTPEYPAAFKWHLYDAYYEVKETAPPEAAKAAKDPTTPGVDALKGSGPCGTPPKFEALALPVVFYAHRSSRYLGKVTISKGGAPTFEPDKKARADDLRNFQSVFASAIEGESLTLRYGGVRGTERVTCGTEVKKGTPEYAAALKSRLTSGYNTLTDAPPTEP